MHNVFRTIRNTNINMCANSLQFLKDKFSCQCASLAPWPQIRYLTQLYWVVGYSYTLQLSKLNFFSEVSKNMVYFLFNHSAMSNSLQPHGLQHAGVSVLPYSRSLLILMFIESVVASSHLILCCLLLLPSVFPSIRVFSNEQLDMPVFIVNEEKVDVLLEFSCFFCDPRDAENLISGFSAFSKSSLYILKFSVHLLLKPSLKDFEHYLDSMRTSLVAQMVKHLPTVWETQVWSLGGEDPLKKEMATHSSTLA